MRDLFTYLFTFLFTSLIFKITVVFIDCRVYDHRYRNAW